MIDRRHALIGTFALGMAGALRASPVATGTPAEPGEIIELWPGDAPGMPATMPVESIEEHDHDPAMPNRTAIGIARPRMAVFRPASPNGSAVLIAPGGGYHSIWFDKEGYEIARWMTARGYTAFVLLYRLPGEGWAAGADVALADAQRAMRIVRSRAARYGIRSDRICAMGFSAGGHLCGDLATRFAVRTYDPVDAADTLSARPDFAAPIYAVQSMRPALAHAGSRALLIGADASPALETAHSTAANVSPDTPPCFLVHAEDDGTVDVANTVEFRAALKAAGVPVDTHLFATGGHGFALRQPATMPVAAWPALFAAWLVSRGFG